MRPDEEERSQLAEWWHQLDLFWPTFLLFVGVVIGGNFSERVRTVTYLTAEILLYRWWIFMVPLLLLVAAVAVIWYLERMERARAEADLSRAERDRIRAEVEDALAAQVRHVERISAMMTEQRQRLQKLMGSVYGEADQLQQDQVAFIYFVDQVSDLLGRRSKRLQAELPDNPVQADKIRQRDEKLQNELSEILQGIGETFPDLTGSIPKPEPMQVPAELPELETDRKEGGRYDLVYMAQKSDDYQGRTMKYKTKRKRRRLGDAIG